MQQDKNTGGIGGNTPGMAFLRIWLWFVPVVMLLAAMVFGAIAAADGNWALAAVMFFLGIVAISLLAFHYWLVYRFGKGGQQ